MATLICPYIGNCVLYKNWTEKTGDKRANIIYGGINNCFCMALDAHNELCAEGGITFNKEISERIKTRSVEKNLNLGDVGCSHITLLNKMNDILYKA